MLDTPPHLKTAFATDSLAWVDADFAWARHLVVYDLMPGKADLLDASAFRRPGETARQPAAGCPGDPGAIGMADQWAARMKGLDGAGVLFTTGLSDRAAMALAAAGTFPVVIEHRRPIHDVITRLQQLMRRDPPLWMCRVLRYGAPDHDRL
ncbi:MAG: nitrogen fixation protein [Magnetospirillum sp.]|nr:nitrogen fixation protein [Magnetospirillum sp.]